ncbi:MAG: tripartite tricarboxylate transporter substrate binding protein [Planctomycetota bacterium]|jgi:tripartite-type tricarboxylate transporter receptor subunit TctC|nr:tripartite tricarboxylate transporter substrate binding protein [Planctomycetota bacterium]
MLKKSFVSMALVAACLVLSACARPGAAGFPTKEIRIIVPYKAGGQSDLAARKIAEISQKQGVFLHPILVVNMSGANTLEGLRAVRDAKPDGYTLLLHHTTMLTMDALGTLNLDWRKAFDMVCQVMEVPYVVSVRSDKPWLSMTEMAEDIKANPGKYIMSVQGVGGSAHFAGLQINQALGITDLVKYMPLTGGNDSAAAMMAGRVDFRPAPSSDVARFFRGGEERVLLFLSDTPSTVYKDAQLANELGIKNPIKMRSGLFTTHGVPADVIKVLQVGMKKIVNTPEFQEFMEAQVVDGVYISGDEWLPLFEADAQNIKGIAKTVNIKQ